MGAKEGDRRGARGGDGGLRPARLGYDTLRVCGGVMSVCEERNELRGALFIAEDEAGIENLSEFSRASPGDEWR